MVLIFAHPVYTFRLEQTTMGLDPAADVGQSHGPANKYIHTCSVCVYKYNTKSFFQNNTIWYYS